jgi:hypothetical protein
MNERIRELAVQAGHRYYPSSNSGPLRVEYLTPELEKFAELIVKECIECADFVGQVNIASGYPNSTAHHVKQKIKQHFGVEE